MSEPFMFLEVREKGAVQWKTLLRLYPYQASVLESMRQFGKPTLDADCSDDVQECIDELCTYTNVETGAFSVPPEEVELLRSKGWMMGLAEVMEWRISPCKGSQPFCASVAALIGLMAVLSTRGVEMRFMCWLD